MGLFSRFRKLRGYALTVQLNARLQPMHRGARFEDPLAVALERVGGAVTGGGSALDDLSRILSCTIDVVIGEDYPDESLDTLIRSLESLSAPRGSRIELGDEVREFGVIEGIAIRMPPLEVDYENDDYIPCSHELDTVMASVTTALADAGEIWSWRLNGSDAEIYVYGASRETIRARLDIEGAELIDIA